MSINYCTLASATVDTFCGTQRAKVLARLITEAGHDIPVTPAVRAGHGSSGGIQFSPAPSSFTTPPLYVPPRVQQPRTRPDDQPQIFQPVDQPFITVTVIDALGLSGSATVNLDSQLLFVTVTDVVMKPFGSIGPADPITVNITEMEVQHAHNRNRK